METVVLGAMAVPGARSHTSRQTAGRTTSCAKVATIGSTSTERRRTASCAETVAWRSSHHLWTCRAENRPRGWELSRFQCCHLSVSQFALEEFSDRTVSSGARRGKAQLLVFSPTMVEKARQRMRNVEKNSAEMAAEVEPNKTVTPTRMLWPRRGVIFARLGKSILLRSFLAASG